MTQHLASGFEYWFEYLEGVGSGTLNNEIDQVQLRYVPLTKDLAELIEFVFPDLVSVDCNRVILATLNTTIDAINARVIDEAPGVSTVYR